MATIKWNKKARQLFVEHVNYARQEFGMTTALRWFRKKNYIEERISRYPESYPLETLLCSKHRTYRRAILMKNFKIVFFDEVGQGGVHELRAVAAQPQDVADFARLPLAARFGFGEVADLFRDFMDVHWLFPFLIFMKFILSNPLTLQKLFFEVGGAAG